MQIIAQLRQLTARLVPAWLSPAGMGLRVIAGRPPRPWPRLTARRITVVAADIDSEAGLAAVWLQRRPIPGAARPAEFAGLFERLGGRWADHGGRRGEPGGGWSGAAPAPAPGAPLASTGGGTSRRLADGAGGDDYGALAGSRWLGYEQLAAGPQVGHLRVGSRLIPVPPGGGRVIAVWAGPDGLPPRSRSGLDRPVIAAEAADGTCLARLDPGRHLDGATLAAALRAAG